MTHQPNIPLSPQQLPHQRIHEVVSLPDRPVPFDSIIHCELPAGSVRQSPPRDPVYLCQVEWAWSPAHSRIDAYYLHRGKGYWSLSSVRDQFVIRPPLLRRN